MGGKSVTTGEIGIGIGIGKGEKTGEMVLFAFLKNEKIVRGETIMLLISVEAM